ncbi:MAG: hypothetical protein RL013_1594, partial [Bacteroidota bacterium]
MSIRKAIFSFISGLLVSAVAVAQADSSAAAVQKHKGFRDLALMDSTIRQEIRYATANNFTKAVIYDCPACL